MLKYILLFLFLGYFPMIYAQSVAIPDNNFLSFLKSEYPNTINAQDELIISQAALETGTFFCHDKNISSVDGIEYFTSLDGLYLSKNNLISLPDLSPITGLKLLHVNDNELTTLPNLSGNIELEYLIVDNNLLTELPDLSSNLALKELVVHNNELTSLPLLNQLTNITLLEVSNNDLTSIPAIDNLIQLSTLKLSHNSLVTLPDISTLTNLQYINASHNLLTTGPDLSSNNRLERIYLDHNLLTTAPNLNGIGDVRHVELDYNFLTFTDFLPYTSRPDFKYDFDISPQNNIQVGYEITLEEGDSYTINTGIDDQLSGVTYDWYYNGQLFFRTFTDNLPLINVPDSLYGYIYCRINYPPINDLELVTDSFLVKVAPCLDISDITYNTIPMNCFQRGEIHLDISSLPEDTYSFILTAEVSDKTLTNNTGVFKGLSEEQYTLKIIADNVCMREFAAPITLERNDCKEVLITPDNDGYEDNYFFNTSGEIIIYDKNGNKINTLVGPLLWEGKTKNNLVVNGYYIAYLKEKGEYIAITVLL